MSRVDALDSPSTCPDMERSRPTNSETRNEENKSEIRSADPTNLMYTPKPHSNKADSILSSVSKTSTKASHHRKQHLEAEYRAQEEIVKLREKLIMKKLEMEKAALDELE